jgi:hypothetical protein
MTIYYLICDNTVRYVHGGGGLFNSNLINFTEEKDSQMGVKKRDDHEGNK